MVSPEQPALVLEKILRVASTTHNKEEDASEGRTQCLQRLALPRQGSTPRSPRQRCYGQPSCLQGSALLCPSIFPSVPQHSPWAQPSAQPSKTPRAKSLSKRSHSTATLPARPSHITSSTPLHPSSVQPPTAPSGTGSREVLVPRQG